MMTEPSLRMWVDVDNPATASQRAQQLMTAILNEAPETHIRRERGDPEAQEIGSVLIVAVSHMAVIGIIEGVRFVWDRFQGSPAIQLMDDRQGRRDACLSPRPFMQPIGNAGGADRIWLARTFAASAS